MTNFIATAMVLSNMLVSTTGVCDKVYNFGKLNGDYLSVADTYSNIVHTVTVTNEYRPKQYKQTMCYPTYPAQYVDTWVDSGIAYGESRDNPDKKIVEVWRHWYIKFKHNGKDYDIEFDKELVDKKVYVRKVETKEAWNEEIK